MGMGMETQPPRAGTQHCRVPGPRGPSPTLGGGGGAEKINFPLFEGSGEGKGGPRGHLPLTHCHRHLRPHLEWREKSEATAIL